MQRWHPGNGLQSSRTVDYTESNLAAFGELHYAMNEEMPADKFSISVLTHFPHDLMQSMKVDQT